MEQTKDMVKFRVGWWFEHHGKGSPEPITSILLDLTEICKESFKVRHSKVEEWVPPAMDVLYFNVNGATRGCLGAAGIGGVLRNLNGKVLCLFSCNVGIQILILRRSWQSRMLAVCMLLGWSFQVWRL